MCDTTFRAILTMLRDVVAGAEIETSRVLTFSHEQLRYSKSVPVVFYVEHDGEKFLEPACC